MLTFGNPNRPVYAFSTSTSSKSPFPSCSTESFSSSTSSLFPIDQNFKPKASARVKTLLFLKDKDTESYAEVDRNGHSQGTVVNGESNENGKQNQSVLDRMSGMFKMSKPNLNLPKQFFPFSPEPPKASPHVEAQLQVDLMESERLIQILQTEVNMLREQLVFQQDDYLKLQNDIRDAQKGERKRKQTYSISQEKVEKEDKLQAQALEIAKRQLDLAQQNMTALEAEYQSRLAAQSEEFVQQRALLEGQMKDLSAQLATITSEFSLVNQTLTSQRNELKKVQQDSKKKKESLQQQISKLEASLKQANSTNLELRDSLNSSNAALAALQKEWQDLVAKQEQEASQKNVAGEQEDQVAMLETENTETKIALEVAERLLEKTLVEREQVELKNQEAWTLERQELESQVESLRLQLANEKMTKEKVLSQYKSAQTKQGLKEKDLQRLLQESQEAMELLLAELDEAKAQYEADLESTSVKKDNDVQTLMARLRSEHTRQEQELQDENAKLKEELANMKKLYGQREKEHQAEIKTLRVQWTQKLEISKEEASKREQVLQTKIETATAEHATKLKSMEEEVDQLRLENESLSSALVLATKSLDESMEEAKVLEKKYFDLRCDQEKWEERVSLMKREFQHAQEEKKELEAQLVTATLEKEQFLLKAQTLEASMLVLTQKNAELEQLRALPQGVPQVQERRVRASNFEWAIDTHSPNRITPI